MERLVQKNKEEIKRRKKSLGENGSSDSKETARNAGDLGLIPGLGRSHEEGKCYPLQCSCLKNSIDRGVWQAIIHGVENSWT